MIALKPMTPDDKERMLDILTHDQIKQTYVLPDFDQKEDATPLFEKLMLLSQDPQHFIRGIYLNNALIGFINNVDIKGGSVEVDYVIQPQYQGQGHMTQALSIAIAKLYKLGYRQILACAFEENIASIRVMQNAT